MRNKSLLFSEDNIFSQSDKKVYPVIAIGLAIRMKFCGLTTQPLKVKAIVSLNSIIVDGTAMCGYCKVKVGRKTRFTSFHSPEFDGHQVNWDLLLARLRTYIAKEKESFEIWKARLQPLKQER